MKNREELIRQIRDFVGTNRTGEAIKILAKEQLSDLDRELILLNSRYSKLAEESRLEIIDEDSARIQLNKINFDLLALTDLIEEQSTSTEKDTPGKSQVASKGKSNKKGPVSSESNSSKNYLMIGVGVLLVAVLGIWAMMGSSGDPKDNSPQTSSKPVAAVVDPQIAKDSLKKELIRRKAITKDSIDRLKEIVLGREFEGGTIFYLDTIARRGLIMANLDARVGEIFWRENLSLEKAGATSKGLFDGRRNTEKIVREFGEGKYPARVALDYEGGNFFDWYLPSEKELDALYDYSRTHAGFRNKYYWSSTEYSGDDNAYYRSFHNGRRYRSIPLNARNPKVQNKGRVRPIRSFYFDKKSTQ